LVQTLYQQLIISCDSISWEQSLFQQQVVGRREGEFERLKCLREERLAEECSLRSQEREVRCKKEYFKRQEEAHLLKIREEEEARKLEGVLAIVPLTSIFF
jgi:translation initiation factor 3 subunit A